MGKRIFERWLQLFVEFLRILNQVPGTFWGVVFGSLFTLLGIYVTNRANDRRLNLQLQNDRRLRDREREMAFRKDVFGSAAEAVALSESALGRFSNLSVPSIEINSILVANSHIFAKVALVANEETVRALSALATELTCAFMRLAQRRVPLEELEAQIKIKTELMHGFAETRRAMLELMTRQNIEGVKDDARFEMIQAQFKFEADRIDATIQEIDHLRAALLLRHIAFVRECLSENARISGLVAPVLIAARKELELSTSLETYASILADSQRTAEAQAEEYLKQLSAIVVGDGRTHAETD